MKPGGSFVYMDKRQGVKTLDENVSAQMGAAQFETLYEQYAAKAAQEPKVVFGGRLGTYKYYDMHNVIDTALTAYEEQVAPLLG